MLNSSFSLPSRVTGSKLTPSRPSTLTTSSNYLDNNFSCVRASPSEPRVSYLHRQVFALWSLSRWSTPLASLGNRTVSQFPLRVARLSPSAPWRPLVPTRTRGLTTLAISATVDTAPRAPEAILSNGSNSASPKLIATTVWVAATSIPPSRCQRRRPQFAPQLVDHRRRRTLDFFSRIASSAYARSHAGCRGAR